MSSGPETHHARLRVLICAYACNPYKGSEEGVGWGWVKAISEHHDLWVITGLEQGKDDIERYLSTTDDLSGRVHFVYVQRRMGPRCLRHFPPYYFWTYRRWQKRAYRVAQELCRSINFDLVHQLTWVSFRVPGYLWKLDKPFVWGPVGGLENTAWRLAGAMDLRGSCHYCARNVVNVMHKVLLLGPRQAFKAAQGGIIAASEATRMQIQRWYGVDSQVVSEIGVSAIRSCQVVRNHNEPLRVSWSGSHFPGKALPFLLSACSRLDPKCNWRLDILGDGPYRSQWQSLARQLRVDCNCNWHGHLPKKDAMSVIRRSHVFVITSIKDLTSSVLLESLSQGVPVVCLDHCGFRDVVTDKCGIKIQPLNKRQIEVALAAAIERLAKDEPFRRVLATGASKRAEDFLWEKKGLIINQIYESKLRQSALPGITP